MSLNMKGFYHLHHHSIEKFHVKGRKFKLDSPRAMIESIFIANLKICYRLIFNVVLIAFNYNCTCFDFFFQGIMKRNQKPFQREENFPLASSVRVKRTASQCSMCHPVQSSIASVRTKFRIAVCRLSYCCCSLTPLFYLIQFGCNAHWTKNFRYNILSTVNCER